MEKALGGYHPFIQGLLSHLPERGTVWTVEGRAAWLKAAAQIFTLMYQGEGAIEVTVTPPATAAIARDLAKAERAAAAADPR